MYVVVVHHMDNADLMENAKFLLLLLYDGQG